MSRSNRKAAAPDKPRYLKIKCKTNKRRETRTYYFWEPRPEDAERYGLPRRVRLAVKHSARCGDGSAYFQACLEAEEWNAKLDSRRQGGPGDATKIAGTLPYFIDAFRKSPYYDDLSEATRVDTYEYGWRVVLQWSEALGHIPVKRITHAHCVDFYEHLSEPDDDGYRSYPRAKNIIASLRRILSYAREKGEIEVNPAFNLNLVSPELRTTRWEPHEIDSFVAQALKIDRASLALSVELAAKLDAAPRHKSGYIVYDEQRDQPYTLRHFNRVFREIADAAGLDHLWYHDLRRTAVCALAHAGATVPEIVAVTGHSLDNATKVLKHYLFPDSELAEAAIAKLIDHQALERREAENVSPEKSDDGLDLTNVIRFELPEAA